MCVERSGGGHGGRTHRIRAIVIAKFAMCVPGDWRWVVGGGWKGKRGRRVMRYCFAKDQCEFSREIEADD